MFSEKNNVREKMSEVINYLEVSEGVQIAVNPNFFNRFADMICKSSAFTLLFDFYRTLSVEISKFRENEVIASDVITKINF